MTTTSQSAVAETIHARLLAYTFGGASIATLAGSRLYIDWPPDNAAFPCAVIRIANWQSDRQLGNVMANFDLECMVYGRGRTAANARTVKQIADLIEQAMLTWLESSPTLGLSFGNDVSRETLPVPPDPFDRDVMAERVTVSCSTVPRYVTDVLAP